MDFQKEFPLDPELCYLNHAAVAPWPARTAQAVSAFAQQNMTQGARAYPEWLKTETELRQRLQAMINAPHWRDIALLKSTSEALSFVAQGLEWNPGDQIVITSDEFPSNRIVWEALTKHGVKVVEANLHGDDSPEEAILDATTPTTKLVSVSSVQYASGIRLNLEHLGRELNRRGILFCVDAIQSIGAHQFDAQRIGADFVMADGHKWMLGPEGLALFYVKPGLRNRLELLEYGWHMVQNRGNYDLKHWYPAEDATRFECGSPNMLGIHALNASLSLLLEVGMEQVEKQLQHNMSILIDALSSVEDIRFLSPRAPGSRAGILTFDIAGVSSNNLYQALMARGVICACRGGGVRFSPHFYTSEEVLLRAVEILKEVLRTKR